MDALRFNPATKDFSLVENTEIPSVEGPDDLIVEVKYAGLCGTDLHIIQGHFTEGSPTTVTLGHEFAGIVKELGSNAREKFSIGDRVGVDPNRGCQTCKFCNGGKTHFCLTKGPRDGVGVCRNGGFTKYCRVHYGQVTALLPEVTLQQGALCEPLSCLLRGWNRLNEVGGVDSGSKILILGAGIIGNFWVSMFHHSGFRKDVWISEPSPGRREITKKLAPEYNVHSPEELATISPFSDPEVSCLTEGVDILIDCTGFPPALEKAIPWMKRGGKICIFGCAPKGRTMSISPETIYARELLLFGTLVNPLTYPTAIQLAANMGERYLDLERLGVEVFRLAQYEEAIEKLKTGGISKVMFEI